MTWAMLLRRAAARIMVLAGIAMLSSCGTLPEAGPSTSAVMNGAAPASSGYQGYDLVSLTEDVADSLNAAPNTANPSSVAAFSALPPAAPLGRIGIGDLLQITLWEANPTGTTLLTPAGLNVSLRVDPSGDIEMPYLGAMHVAGRTAMSVQRRIMAVLAAQGHSIQAAVLDSEDVSGVAVVTGEANRPGAYPLNDETDSLLDLIALAGGPRIPDNQVMVDLRRGDLEATASLADINNDPDLNVAVEAGDTVMLESRNLVYYAFGAVNRPGVFSYQAPNMTLVQALGDIAGLQDSLAAPKGVFIYRRDSGAAVAQTIYQLDLTDPASFFTAGIFVLHPNDIIYVSDAPIGDVSKVLQVVSGVSNIAAVPRNFGGP
jgi:polysaccharide export outer membrane protein